MKTINPEIFEIIAHKQRLNAKFGKSRKGKNYIMIPSILLSVNFCIVILNTASL